MNFKLPVFWVLAIISLATIGCERSGQQGAQAEIYYIPFEWTTYFATTRDSISTSHVRHGYLDASSNDYRRLMKALSVGADAEFDENAVRALIVLPDESMRIYIDSKGVVAGISSTNKKVTADDKRAVAQILESATSLVDSENTQR